MRYAQLELSAFEDPKYCRAARIEDAEGTQHLLTNGTPLYDRDPTFPSGVRIHLDRAHIGVALGSRLSNTNNLLILTRTAIDALNQALNLGPFELHPFELINHKGRIHSLDYLILHPLTLLPLGHPDSEIDRFETSGNPYYCERWVLDARALHDAPDLVRSKQLPEYYFASERFVAAVQELGLTNFVFTELEHREEST